MKLPLHLRRRRFITNYYSTYLTFPRLNTHYYPINFRALLEQLPNNLKYIDVIREQRTRKYFN